MSTGTLGPSGLESESFGALADANEAIDLYIASLMFLPDAIPLGDGRDLLQVLGVADKLAAARSHTTIYTDNVGDRLRGLRDGDIPACSRSFQTFATTYRGLGIPPVGAPIPPDTRDRLVVAIGAFVTPLATLQARLTAMNSGFAQFHGLLIGDLAMLGDLATLFHPDDPGGIVRRIGLSAADVALAQAAITDNAPTFEQDVGVAQQKAGAMLASLSQVTDAFAILGGKVASVIGDLKGAERPTTPPLLDQVLVQAAEGGWQQFAGYVQTLGF